MKKLAILWLSVIFAASLVMAVGCSSSSGKTKKDDSVSETFSDDFKESASADDEGEGKTEPSIKSKRFVVVPSEEIDKPKYKLESSFMDSNEYYYLYYIGQIQSVPLQTDVEKYYYSGANFSKEFTTTVTTSVEVSSIVTNTRQNLYSYSETLEDGEKWKSNVGVSLGIKDVANLDVSKTYETAISKSKTNTDSYTTSYTQSIQNAVTYSETITDKTTINFNETFAHGYYRYVLVGNIDFFTLVIKNPYTGTYVLQDIELIADKWYTLDYSDTADFHAYESERKLVFDMTEDEIAELETPTEYMTEDHNLITATLDIDPGYVGAGYYYLPYFIHDEKGLDDIRNKDGEGVYFKIVEDIDLTAKSFTPIDDFVGNLDGDDHFIYNFNYTETGNYGSVGLFRENHGTIANLKIASKGEGKYSVIVPEKGHRVFAAGLVAYNYGEVYNCGANGVFISAATKFSTSDNYVSNIYYIRCDAGGLIGHNANQIKYCFAINCSVSCVSTASVKSNRHVIVQVGGAIGSSEKNEFVKIEDCYAYNNTLSAMALNGMANTEFVGGFAEETYYASNIISYSNVLLKGSEFGQIIGYNLEGGYIYNSYSINCDEKEIIKHKRNEVNCGVENSVEAILEKEAFKKSGVWTIDENGNVAFNEKVKYVFAAPVE
ncbi:MAG: hypothetical protein J6N93_01590 [Clostridia bacterium]|nr:hypothetical protein [Clostridia bacterium]